jgi:hypothetical protein
MTVHSPNTKTNKEFELITPYDLVIAAKEVMGEIDLDPASSKFANEYVRANKIYTPSDDALNTDPWEGNVYLFPPTEPYFWDAKQTRWRSTRSHGAGHSYISGAGVWWKTLKRKWLNKEIKQGIYFTNIIDMVMYCQDIFDFPICFLRSRPMMMRRYYKDDSVMIRTGGTSIIVYLQPQDNVTKATETFIDVYGPKGRIIV